MDRIALLIGIGFMAAAQVAAWLQLNGQFVWGWCKKHEWFMIIAPSIPISFFYLYATKYLAQGFQGLLWPGRFVSFGIGIIVFAILTYYLNSEGLTTKTMISLTLAVCLLGVQVFWK